MKKILREKLTVPVTRRCWIIAAIGALICVFMFIVLGGNDRNSAYQTMKSVADYVKQQCIRYDEIVAESAAKDLLILSDKTADMRDELMLCMGNTDLLKAIAKRKKLDGIVIYSTETGEYDYFLPEGETEELWKEVIDYYPATADDLQKTYTDRFKLNGLYYDYAAVGRTDVHGVLLAFTRKNAAEEESARLSVKNLLSGYEFGRQGIVIVTDGTFVIAANKETHLGMKAEECEIVSEIRTIKTFNALLSVNDGYAVREMCKNYFIYVYLPGAEVYAERDRLSSLTVLLYIAVLTAVFTLRRRFFTTKAAEQAKKDAAYREELDRLAAEAIRANEAKTDFLRRMSHDVRTPINGIRGMIKIGDYYAEDLEKQKECREKVWKASGYLLDLVNGVLDMTKLDAKEVVWRDEYFSVSDLINEIGSVTGYQARERGVNLTVKAENIEHDKLFGAATLLKRICTNLITNAINYNVSGGSADFSVKETGFDETKASFLINCADTGIGMSKEFMEKMFEPFEQEATGSENRTGGSGLGLAIVKKAVEKMGGVIEVRSEKGVGTSFTVSLSFPLAEGAEITEKSERDESEEIAKEPLAGYHVLVVEDNDINLEIAEFMLKTAGAKVLSARNGEEAISAFLSKPERFFDVILMDVIMPVKDGIVATEEIRKLARADAPTVPIIAMTANAFYDDEEIMSAAGMNGCVTKPLEAAKLIRTILFAIENDGGGCLLENDKH